MRCLPRDKLVVLDHQLEETRPIVLCWWTMRPGAVESNRNLLKPGLRAGSFINKHLKQLPFDAWQPLDLRDRWRRGAGGQVSPRSLTWVQQSLQPDDVWHSADSPRGDRRDLSAPAKPARSKGCKSLTTKT